MTVSGAVGRPGVLEIATGTSIRSVLHAAGGTTEPISAVLVGGYFGAWLPAETAMDVALDQETLAELGAGFGCGVLVALPSSSCGLTETARVMSYLASESAEQCGPCIHGLASLADGLGELAHGPSSANAVAWLRRWADQIRGRGACHHPDGAIRLLASALHAFASDIDVHIHRGSCHGSRAAPILPVPDHTGEGWR
jgi:NADH:ubiquinone oxidoreductase subunit F (NADH-binding)